MRIHALLSFLLIAGPLSAQEPAAALHGTSLAEAPPPRFERVTTGPVGVLAERRADLRQQTGAAFPVEFLGAAAGSLVGLGAGLLLASPNDCDEDLACMFERIGIVGLLSVVGAPAGTMLAGGWAGTRPSLLGAALGSVVGAAAGAGVLKLGEEIGDGSIPVVYAVIGYTGVHALLTAAGSRLGALIRD